MKSTASYLINFLVDISNRIQNVYLDLLRKVSLYKILISSNLNWYVNVGSILLDHLNTIISSNHLNSISSCNNKLLLEIAFCVTCNMGQLMKI